MFSVGGGRSRSTAAVSALSAACSMLVVRPQRRLGRRFVDECAARQSCHVSKRAMHIVLVHRRLVSAGPRCTVACVRDAICGTASTTCIGFSVRLEASATLGVPESHGRSVLYLLHSKNSTSPWSRNNRSPPNLARGNFLRILSLNFQYKLSKHWVTFHWKTHDSHFSCFVTIHAC